jgi:hypothetical protein
MKQTNHDGNKNENSDVGVNRLLLGHYLPRAAFASEEGVDSRLVSNWSAHSFSGCLLCCPGEQALQGPDWLGTKFCPTKIMACQNFWSSIGSLSKNWHTNILWPMFSPKIFDVPTWHPTKCYTKIYTISAIKPYVGFGVDDHRIRGLIRFGESISRK